jgi:hypothetical protein
LQAIKLSCCSSSSEGRTRTDNEIRSLTGGRGLNQVSQDDGIFRIVSSIIPANPLIPGMLIQAISDPGSSGGTSGTIGIFIEIFPLLLFVR